MGALDFLSDYFYNVTPKKKHKPMQVCHMLLSLILSYLCMCVDFELNLKKILIFFFATFYLVDS
jgi:hypothetical protein